MPLTTLDWGVGASICFALAICSLPRAGGTETAVTTYPEAIQAVLKCTKPLTTPRGNRMPLLLWPVHAGVVQDEATQEAIIRDLDARGMAMIATWNPANREKSLPTRSGLHGSRRGWGSRSTLTQSPACTPFTTATRRRHILTTRTSHFLTRRSPATRWVVRFGSGTATTS